VTHGARCGWRAGAPRLTPWRGGFGRDVDFMDFMDGVDGMDISGTTGGEGWREGQDLCARIAKYLRAGRQERRKIQVKQSKHCPMPPEPLIPKHGGFRKLKSFQIAQLCYDVTVRFCDRYIEKRSRTHDQMVQAARSGVQNIAEGSSASATSKKTELKLTNVARASLEELRLDYEDFLRQRGLQIWAEGDPRCKALVARRCATADAVAEWVREVRGLHGQHGLHGQGEGAAPSMKSMASMRSTYPEIAANAALVLIGVACTLLYRQIQSLGAAFVEEGGFTERLHRVRSERKRDAP
jgi:four helix bundle suffix protein